MRILIINMILVAIFAIGFTGCSDKKETQHMIADTNSQSFENFAPKPKDTSSDDRSPIRYQK